MAAINAIPSTTSSTAASTEETPAHGVEPTILPTPPPPDEPSGPAVAYAVPVADRGAGFAAYEPVMVTAQPRVPPYSTALRNITNPSVASPLSDRQENLYRGWLHSLAPLLEPVGEGYPASMQNQAWVDKDLHTYFGSWAELKHDTILYAKQGYAVAKGGRTIEAEPVHGYVEP